MRRTTSHQETGPSRSGIHTSSTHTASSKVMLHKVQPVTPRSSRADAPNVEIAKRTILTVLINISFVSRSRLVSFQLTFLKRTLRLVSRPPLRARRPPSLSEFPIPSESAYHYFSISLAYITNVSYSPRTYSPSTRYNTEFSFPL